MPWDFVEWTDLIMGSGDFVDPDFVYFDLFTLDFVNHDFMYRESIYPYFVYLIPLI